MIFSFIPFLKIRVRFVDDFKYPKNVTLARNNDRLICMYSKIYFFQCMCNIFNIFNKTFSVSSLKVLKILNLLLNCSIKWHTAYHFQFLLFEKLEIVVVGWFWEVLPICSDTHVKCRMIRSFFNSYMSFCFVAFFCLQWLVIILLVASSRNKRWDSGGPFLLSCWYWLSQFCLASELTRQSICDSN